jgi:hypothetical protein
MRRSVKIALAAGIVLLAGATAVLFAKYQKASSELASTRLSEEQVTDRYNRTIQAVAEIQDSLNAISVGEGGVPAISQQLDAERKLGGPSGEQALDRIALLRTSINQSKERIAQLEKRVKESGIKVSGLQKLIANLKTSVAEKEQQVADLTARVDMLNTQVTGLTVAVQETQDTLRTRDEQLETKRREAATVFYVIGSKKELSESGVIRSSGGVLGIGKTVLPAANPSPTAFTALDTDQETVIRTSLPKVRVVSAQPASSYELRTVNGQMELHILNAAEFRKVKQVVIMEA